MSWSRKAAPRPETRAVPPLPVDLDLYDEDVVGRWRASQDALRPYTAAVSIGDPFGPGLGLETVVAWLGVIFGDTVQRNVVLWRNAEVLAEAIRTDRLDFDLYDAACGMTRAGWNRAGLTTRRRIEAATAPLDRSKDSLMTFSFTDRMAQVAAWDAAPVALPDLAYYEVVGRRLEHMGRIVMPSL